MHKTTATGVCMRKILVLSTEAWDDTNSGGNTYSNLFSDWEDGEFSNVFCRSASPNNRICKKYFRITDGMLLKNLFRPSKIGQAFLLEGEPTQREEEGERKEKKLISFIHRHNFRLAYAVEDILWKGKGWKNKKLDHFLEEQAPDVIFSFAIPTVQRERLLSYLREKTGAKVVLMIADHVCARYFSTQGKRGKAATKRMRKILGMADKVYAITDELADAYGKEFSVDVSILRKGCRFETETRKQVGEPARIVYAGNLLYGRLEILQRLAATLSKLNGEGMKAALEIYSGTPISEEEAEKLNILGASTFFGVKPFSEIKRILAEADLLLHVESFEEKQMETVKYSFSTKITDALESGGGLLVIGPNGISSVEYSRKIPGATVIDSLEKVEERLRALLSSKEQLINNAEKIRAFAIENHSAEGIYSLLRGDIETLCER